LSELRSKLAASSTFTPFTAQGRRSVLEVYGRATSLAAARYLDPAGGAH